MTCCAIVAEQSVARLAHDRHQRWIGLDRGNAFGLDLLGPDAAIGCCFLQRSRHEVALIYAEQAFRVGHTQRPGRHEQPVAGREQEGQQQEEIDHSWDRRVQFLDPVPFMAGGEIPGVTVAVLLLYRHGLSSSSRMERAA
jgi:hypothetical protein